MPDTLRVGLLGPLQVRNGPGHVVHVGGRQLRVLLTLLALAAGRVVPSSSLANQIWPEEPPANPGNALQTLVSRLRAELRRSSLDHVIESHPAGYRLAVRPDAVDALAFETLAVRELLAGRLGVDPSAQLEQVYLRILRGEEGAEPAAKRTIRSSDNSFDTERAVVPAHVTSAHPVAMSTLTSFVGRDTEVSQVLKNLGSARLVTLTGPGGVGKTRLATEVSGRLAGGGPAPAAGRAGGRS